MKNHLTLLLLSLACTGLYAQVDNTAPFWLDIRLKTGHKYDQFWPLDTFCAKIELNGHFGLVNRRGIEICPPDYEDIGWGGGALYTAKKNGRFGALNARGELVVPCQYIGANAAGMGCAVLQDSLWGVFDVQGNKILPFQFPSPPILDETAIIGSIDNVHAGAWDWSGHMRVPARFHALEHRELGCWDAELFGKHGLLSPDGQPLSAFKYQKVSPLPGGAFVGQKNGTDIDVYDGTGKKICERSYVWSYESSNGWFNVVTRDSVWLISPAGKFIPAPPNTQFAEVQPCPEGIFLTTVFYDEGHGPIGWFNVNTGKAVEARFKLITFNKDTVYALGGETSGKYDLNGRLLEKLPITSNGEWANAFCFYFDQNGKEGIMDKKLRVMLPPVFDHLQEDEGGVMVKKGDKTGFYDLHGREIIPIRYESLQLDRGATFFMYTDNNRSGVLDLKGNLLIPAAYNRLTSVGFGNFIAEKQGKSGLISRNGTILLPFIYDEITPSYDNSSCCYLLLKTNNKWGWADAKGKILLPVEYESLDATWPTIIAHKNSQYRGYSKDGRAVIPGIYTSMSRWSGVIIARKDGKYGVFDPSNAVILPFIYDTIYAQIEFLKARRKGDTSTWRIWYSTLIPADRLTSQFSSVLYVMETGGKKGLSDVYGHAVWPPVYDQIQPLFDSPLIALGQKGKDFQLLDTLGNAQFNFQADSLLRIDSRFVYFLRQHQKIALDLETLKERPAGDIETFSYNADLALILGKIGSQEYKMFDENFAPVHPDLVLGVYENDFSTDYVIIRDGKRGKIGKGGKILINPEYDQLFFIQDGILMLEIGNKKGLWNQQTGKQLPVRFSEISAMENGWYMVEMNGLKGCYDENFELIIPIQYSSIERYNKRWFVVNKNGAFGLINQNGKEILPPLYDGINVAQNQDTSPDSLAQLYATIQLREQYGILSEKGKILVPVQYSSVGPTGAFYYATNADYTNDLYNQAGKRILSNWKGYFDAYNGHFLIMRQDGNQGVIDDLGHWILPLGFEEIQPAGDFFIAKKAGHFGLFRTDGKAVLPMESDAIAPPYDGSPYFFIWENGKFTHFDGKNRWLKTSGYDFADPFVRGLAAVRKNGKWGFIDTAGRVAIPLQFDYAEPFHNFNGHPRAVVLKNKAYYFIDSLGRNQGAYTAPTDLYAAYFYRPVHVEKGFRRLVDDYGRLIFESRDYGIQNAQSGLLVCFPGTDDPCRHSGEGLMDFAGNLIVKPAFGYIMSFGFCHSDLAPVQVNYKYGFINRQGQVAISIQYDMAGPFCEFGCDPPTARVTLNGKQQTIDLKGRCVQGCE